MAQKNMQQGVCSVDGCGKRSRAMRSLYCEAHYYRLRRNGTMALKERRPSPKLRHSQGYVLVYVPGHAMATKGHSHAYQHRVVFYDAHGGGPFDCHVCGKSGTLDDMHVDHLNEVKDDNRLDNLKPACPLCNQWRGKTREQVARRGSHVVWLEYNGERLPISEWARRIGIARHSISWRLSNGWTLAEALTKPRGVTGPLASARRLEPTRNGDAA